MDLDSSARSANSIDPLVEAFKQDVDRTLIIENLRKTPHERVLRMEAALRFAVELRRAGREAFERSLRRPGS
jgi:hypothetical protein